MKILITGCAGFIGYHTCLKYLSSKRNIVVGLDSLNSYYSTKLKKDRLKELKKKSKKNFKFIKVDICNFNFLIKKIGNYKFDLVIHLAAQAGVRYSIENPSAYIRSNINGFFNILEFVKKNNIKHLIFASSSSVYGNSSDFPLLESDPTNSPLQLYAATKKSDEVIGSAYSYLYKIKITAIRFFTVYGPWGRPDMSLFKFVKNIKNNKKIDLYNYSKHTRDFTYIDDLINGIDLIKKNNNSYFNKDRPFRIFNIGSDNPITLNKYVSIIERKLKKKAFRNYKKLQMGDIKKTHASIDKIKKLGYIPKTNPEKGISNFIDWFEDYYE